MAWLGIVIIIIFIYMDTQDHAIYPVWIHFIPTSLFLRREKPILVGAGIELLHKSLLKPLDHCSSGKVFYIRYSTCKGIKLLA